MNIETELLAGDFGVDSDILKEMFAYFHKLHLIQIEDENIKCEGLENRLAPLITKRAKMRHKRALRAISQDLCDTKTPASSKRAAQMPQSKDKDKVKGIINNTYELANQIKNLNLKKSVESRKKIWQMVELHIEEDWFISQWDYLAENQRPIDKDLIKTWVDTADWNYVSNFDFEKIKNWIKRAIKEAKVKPITKKVSDYKSDYTGTGVKQW
jgi:hypothetical protein